MAEAKPINVAAAVVLYKNKVLLAKRKGGYLNNLWEFPGGKLEKGESEAMAAKREIAEELNTQIEPLKTILVLEHDYPDKRVRLHFVLCLLSAEAEKQANKLAKNPEVGWFLPSELPLNDFCPADCIAARAINWAALPAA